MSDFIGIDVSGEEIIAAKLKKLPATAQDTVTDEVSKYLISSILKQYPPRNYVTRASAYGQTFFTEKQRRWFFAALNSGELKLPYHRTQGLAKSWKQAGSGARSFVYSDYKGAGYVVGDDTQSRHESKVGWWTVSSLIQKHMKSIMDKTDGAIKRAIKKLGL